jgi:hypothetical protein
LWACACASEAPGGAASIAPIIDGTYDPADPAVVAILEQSGALVCTGTLVSPRVLVSAAHCVILSSPRYAFFGPDPRGDGQYVDVLSSMAHPEFDLETFDRDISLIVLSRSAPDFAGDPILLGLVAPTPGLEVRMVGYGFTEVGPAGEYARKHQRLVVIDEVNEISFRYGIATCNGDSGGPALVEDGGSEVLVGVTSFGDAACSDYGVDARVDAFRDWILAGIESAGGPSCDAGDECLESCVPRDVDCPVTDLGATCQRDFDCGAEVCAESRCRTRCDPMAEESSCAADESCEPQESLVVGGVGACIPDAGCSCRVGGRRGLGKGVSAVMWLAAVLSSRRRRAPKA